jgi:hypothetical protein
MANIVNAIWRKAIKDVDIKGEFLWRNYICMYIGHKSFAQRKNNNFNT